MSIGEHCEPLGSVPAFRTAAKHSISNSIGGHSCSSAQLPARIDDKCIKVSWADTGDVPHLHAVLVQYRVVISGWRGGLSENCAPAGNDSAPTHDVSRNFLSPRRCSATLRATSAEVVKRSIWYRLAVVWPTGGARDRELDAWVDNRRVERRRRVREKHRWHGYGHLSWDVQRRGARAADDVFNDDISSAAHQHFVW